MKNYILLIVISCLCWSCGKNSKEIEQQSETGSSVSQASDVNASKDELGQLQDLLNLAGKDTDGTLSSDGAPSNAKDSPLGQLQDLLDMSGKEGKENEIGISVWLELLEASGVSRSEMEKLIQNPDSLKMLAKAKIAERKAERLEKEAMEMKGKISPEVLTAKNPSTGISLEEAIMIVNAETGVEATEEKLKKIDSIAGTNVMAELSFDEAEDVFADVSRKNEPKASLEEEKKMKKMSDLAGQIHSEKEAFEVLARLEKDEKDINSGVLKASPRYQKSLKYQKSKVKIFQKDITARSNAAKEKFQQLNPDLYYGEEVGESYLGFKKKAVYLPLGKLSFADEVISANHPKLMIQEVKNVLGEPDVIETFDDVSGIHSLGLGGDLTIRFSNNALIDVNGPDLYIFEIGQIEPTDLEISKDGQKWIKVGKIDGGVAEVDIANFVAQGELFYYVRLKDLKKQSALPGADVDAIAAIGAAMRLNLDSKVLFDLGKSELKPAGKEALKELVKSIAVLKSGRVIVEGHTDDVGSNETNQQLSLARAKSVSAELKKLLPSKDFTWRENGFGEDKPLVENDSKENRAKNRRVEVLVVPN